MKVCSLFAGIGGIDKGFEQAGFEIVYANEFDKQACKTYRTNNNPNILDECDITKKDISLIPEFDVLVGGFPCQTFSKFGKQKAFDDPRGLLFREIVKILRFHMPIAFMLENVPRLVTINNGDVLKTILDELGGAGYECQYKILGAHTHSNIPQGRKRVFIVGFQKSQPFHFPSAIPLTTTIDDIIDRATKVDNKYYYTPSHKDYDIINKGINNGSIYQYRRPNCAGDPKVVRENKSGVCPTLTTNHDQPIIRDNFGIRRLTPMEYAGFQGYDNFVQVGSDPQAYKQLGNGVVVPLIKRIAQNLDSALQDF